jgi:hypothetical protein
MQRGKCLEVIPQNIGSVYLYKVKLKVIFSSLLIYTSTINFSSLVRKIFLRGIIIYYSSKRTLMEKKLQLAVSGARSEFEG